MKKLILFENIVKDKDLQVFKDKFVHIELYEKNSVLLESKYLSICFQVAEYLSIYYGTNYSVSDVIYLNYKSIFNKIQVVNKIDKENNAVFIFQKKHYQFMNQLELHELIQDTIQYWKPIV